MTVLEMLTVLLGRWRDAVDRGEACQGCGAEWRDDNPDSPGVECLDHAVGCPTFVLEQLVQGEATPAVVGVETEDPYPDERCPLYRVEWPGWVMHIADEGNGVFADARRVA